MRTHQVATFAQTLDLNNALVARRTVVPALRAVAQLLGVFLAVCLTGAVQGAAQGPQAAAGEQAQGPRASISFVPQPRITAAVDMRQTVEAKGSVHPLAKPEFDRGAVPDEMPPA